MENTNAQEYSTRIVEGVPYLNMTDSARYTNCGRTWFSSKLNELEAGLKEQDPQAKLRHTFPGSNNIYVSIVDLNKYFFTPVEEQ